MEKTSRNLNRNWKRLTALEPSEGQVIWGFRLWAQRQGKFADVDKPPSWTKAPYSWRIRYEQDHVQSPQIFLLMGKLPMMQGRNSRNDPKAQNRSWLYLHQPLDDLMTNRTIVWVKCCREQGWHHFSKRWLGRPCCGTTIGSALYKAWVAVKGSPAFLHIHAGLLTLPRRPNVRR